MQGNKNRLAFHIPGTLAADIAIKFTAESDFTILHVSAVASNDSDATITVGTSADADGFLTATTIGDSGTPAEFDLDDWDGALLSDVGSEYPRVTDGTIVAVDIDYDGSAGTAAQNVTVVMTVVEG